MDCKKPIETMYIGDVAIDTLDSVPDYILAERDVVDPNTNKTTRSMVRVPGQKLFGSGNLDNVTTIEPNNTISVPENQVLAGKIVNNGSYNTVELAGTSDEVDFLIVGKLTEQQLLIQNTGFVYFPNGHQYIVGQTYYSGANGVPTTATGGRKLFKPISTTKLAIKLGQ